jgi:ADP-heptose:LPS heptosyltransferase
MISRAVYFFNTVQALRRETHSNRRTATFVARLFRQKVKLLAVQTSQHLAAPRREAALAAIANDLGEGEPSIGIRVSGGIGDYVVIARFMRDLLAHSKEPRLDVYCSDPANASWVFASVPGFRSAQHDILFDRYLPFYDLAMRVSQFALVHEEHVNWDKLRAMPGLAARIDAMLRFRPSIESFVQQHPYTDNFLAMKAVYDNRTRRDYLHSMAKLKYGGDQLALPVDSDTLVAQALGDRPYITVHNGFDTGYVISGDWATKCYPHFAAVVAKVRQALPNYAIVQIGTSTSKPIPGVDLNLVSKTTLKQVTAVISRASLHLDNEGGLVHVAACLGVPACVVFGPTPSAYFGYPSNHNIDPVFCGGCWWIKKTWMDCCPRGYSEARCMHEQPPEYVADRVIAALTRNRAIAAD